MSQTIELPVAKTVVPIAGADSFLVLVERAARDPSVDVGKMERLLEMAEKVHARQAEATYNEAMNAAQAEMRPVAQDSSNPQTHSRYASYGAMDNALRPIYSAHGFSLSFGTKAPGPDRVTVTCRVSHRAGHTEKVEIEMPADGKGAKGNDVMTKTHATGSAVSYGMRYLLKMIFNVSVGEYDDDGNAAGRRSKMPQDAPKPHTYEKVVKTAPAPNGGAKNTTPEKGKTAKSDEKGWDAFLAACKNRLLEKIDRNFEWAWWRYAVDRDWILPTAESLADARPDKMFEGFDKTNANTAKDSVSEIFKKHTAAVDAMAAACPPEMREELLRGMTPMNQTTVPQGQELPKAPRLPSKVCCPVCKGTAIKKHKDLVGCSWCEKDGTMWQDSDPTEGYEEHEWMWAKLPFAPKDAAKASYKGKTLGQLSRLDPRYWFGTVMNFEAKEYKGRPPSQESVDFADACEQARKHLEEAQADYKGSGRDGGNADADDDEAMPSGLN